MIRQSACRFVLCLTVSIFAALLLTGCVESEPEAPPVATPGARLNHDSAPAGSPLEITYTFVVANDARFTEDYRVFVHVMDIDQEQMWDDDHDPAVPTTQWKPGQTIEYTRTVFVPVFPYVGEATIQIGLYARTSRKRLPLSGEHVGQNAYRVAKVRLLPQTDNLLTIFRDGWHQAEIAGDNATLKWQWTKKEATLAFKNPKKSAVYYLELDSPGGNYHGAQQIQVVLGGQAIEEFTLDPNQRVLRRVQLPVAAIGEAEIAELQFRVDKTWIPAQVPAANNPDKRELGVRVFHAFADPR